MARHELARHESRATRLWGLLVLGLLMMVFLTGCSSRNGSGSLALDAGPGPLTAAERAAFENSTSVIARQVPAHARGLVEEQMSFYLHGARKTIAIHSKRAENHLAYARGVFRSYGLPEELAYLAIVESGYNPKARSGAGAAGAWQFMPYTGLKYGLQQDRWYDERLDVYAATHAAAQYLKKLHGQFRDWPTAIAAYNAGEGKMGRACAAAREKTFFGVVRRNDQLDEKTRLRRETLQYVPRFVAVMIIMENLEAFGFEPIRPERATHMVRVELQPGTNLKAMARACNMSWAEFGDANPHFLSETSHAKRRTNAYVPQDRVARAVAFAKNPVRSTKTGLAGATLAQGSSAKGSSANSSRAATAATASTAVRSTYIVKPGDTLTRVAKSHNTTVQALLAANGIANANAVHVGQTLVIPGKTVVASTASTATRAARAGKSTYQVQPNDNLWQISRKLNVSVAELQRWNNLKGQDIRVGQRLVVMR